MKILSTLYGNILFIASAITNLADIVVAIAHGSLTVLKNRAMSTLGKIICNYDPANRRIFSATYGDATVYAWNHEGITIPEVQACNHPAFAIQYGNQDLAAQPF